MNTSLTSRLAPSLRTASLRLTKRPLAVPTLRYFASFGEESPLDRFLDPSAPTPLYNSTEPYQRPKKLLECGVDENVLRFKTRCYGRLLLAPFVHPNEHKVVLSVDVDDLPLASDLERDILKEIVGSRWIQDKNELRLASVSFGSRIENKRHLVSMLNRLVMTCQRLAAEVEEAASNQAA